MIFTSEKLGIRVDDIMGATARCIRCRKRKEKGEDTRLCSFSMLSTLKLNTRLFPLHVLNI